MQDILVLGAGKIGALICGLLADSGAYRVQLADKVDGAADEVASAHGLDNIQAFSFDAADSESLTTHVKKHKPTAVISGLPYYCNVGVAEVARNKAFNTSGGLGSLAETYDGRVTTMNYKTIRYPGHCDQIRLLMNGMKLNEDRRTLKRILENAVPQTLQDVVIIYAAVIGMQEGELREENYVNKVYPEVVAGWRNRTPAQQPEVRI